MMTKNEILTNLDEDVCKALEVWRRKGMGWVGMSPKALQFAIEKGPTGPNYGVLDDVSHTEKPYTMLGIDYPFFYPNKERDFRPYTAEEILDLIMKHNTFWVASKKHPHLFVHQICGVGIFDNKLYVMDVDGAHITIWELLREYKHINMEDEPEEWFKDDRPCGVKLVKEDAWPGM